MHIIKKLVLSVAITSLISSPVVHANDITSLWSKSEHKAWIISGAAVCVALLAVLAWYTFSTNEKKITSPSSANVPPVIIQALDAHVPVQVKVHSPKSHEQPGQLSEEQSVSSSEQDALLPYLSPREVALGGLGDDSESDEEANRIRSERALKKKNKKISKKHEKKAKNIEQEVDDFIEKLAALDQEVADEVADMEKAKKSEVCVEVSVPVDKQKFTFDTIHQKLSAQGILATTSSQG